MRYCTKYELIQSCIECSSEEILFDTHRNIVFCANCGLILVDFADLNYPTLDAAEDDTSLNNVLKELFEDGCKSR